MTQLSPKITAGLLSALLGAGAFAPAGDEIREQQWHLGFLGIEHAHEFSTGEGVIVGVIDSGVDGGHPDLAGRLLAGADIDNPGSDGLQDKDGHGTAMAGLIAANGRALGIAPAALILPVRSGDYFRGIHVDEAVDWAVDHGATVLCLAFSQHETSEPLRSAVARAVAADVVVVAAVGNLPEGGLQYPAGYPGVVGAAGVDRNGNRAEISVISPAADLSAPAVDIVSTASRAALPSGYRSGTGTSDATAIIAGVAALVRSRFPDLSAEEVIHRITYTADDRGSPGRDSTYGWGIVNPVAALTADVPPLHPTTRTPIDATPTPRGGSPRVALVAGSAGVLVLLVVAGVLVSRGRR